MRQKMISLFKKYKEVISYSFFGVLTTLINIIIYFILTRIYQIDYIVSTVIAWAISVLFAYITNKIFVFESKELGIYTIIRELGIFIVYRLLSGGIDIIIMYIAVDCLSFPDGVVKIISNIIVILINYVASKLVIFKKAETR